MYQTITHRIVNILIGLGLPWMVAALSGSPTRVPGHETLQVGFYSLFLPSYLAAAAPCLFLR